jgi:Protein of unknown function (DUF2877)
MRALFAAPTALRALSDGRRGEVAVTFRGGAYLRLDRDWVLIAGAGAPFGPLSLALEGAERLAPHPGTPVRMVGEDLLLDGCEVSLRRARVRPCLPLGTEEPAPWGEVAEVTAAVRAELREPSALLMAGLEALASRPEDLRRAAMLLAGLGEGLTPAGDDVLAGYAAWGVAAGPAVACAPPLSELTSRRSSPLGSAYLRAAEWGELPDPAARLLSSIRRGSIPAALAALHELRSWGASSGEAIGWGIVAAAPASGLCDPQLFERRSGCPM